MDRMRCATSLCREVGFSGDGNSAGNDSTRATTATWPTDLGISPHALSP